MKDENSQNSVLYLSFPKEDIIKRITIGKILPFILAYKIDS